MRSSYIKVPSTAKGWNDSQVADVVHLELDACIAV